jgi:hypothetical protein
MSTSRTVAYKSGSLPASVPDGRVYERKGRVTSVVTSGAIVKSAEPFGTVARARRAYEDWAARGYGGAPSSPARVFARVFEEAVEAGAVPHPLAVRPRGEGGTVTSAIDPAEICWLWIDLLVPARSWVTGGVYHYDLNEAFYSAVAEGLPSAFFPYRPGDDHWVGAVEINGSDRELPQCWQVQDRAYLTAADVRHWGMDVDVLDAYTYVDLDVDLGAVMEEISRAFGAWTAKRARQQSWGIYAQSSGSVRQKTYRGGALQTETVVPDRWTCPEWAVIVTRRIMRRVDRALRAADGVSCFVDSILSREPLPGGLGTEVGQWRIEGMYPEGVYLEAPGVWDDVPLATEHPSSQWRRHAGIAPTLRRSTADGIDTERPEPMIEDDSLPF